MSKSPKANTDNSLLSAYVDSPQTNENMQSRSSPQNSSTGVSMTYSKLTSDILLYIFCLFSDK